MPRPAPYPNTDFAETEAIQIFRSLLDLKRIKLDIKERDKVPNTDGLLEIVDVSNVPIAKLEVQIRANKKGHKYQCPTSLVEYSDVTTLPLLLISVDRANKVVYWKHIHSKMPEYQGKESNDTFKIEFDRNCETVHVESNYLDDWYEVARAYQTRLHGENHLYTTPGESRNSLSRARPHKASKKQIKDILSKFSATSKSLIAVPSTIDGNTWIERPLLDDLYNRVVNEASSTTLLLGSPGSGKSALLSKLAEKSISENIATLSIKADTIPAEVDSMSQLENFLDVTDLVHKIRLVGTQAKVLILIDQLDSLADLVDLKSQRLNLLLSLINQLSNDRNIHILASCRTFEAEHDPRLKNIQPKPETIELTLPQWKYIEPLFQSRGIITTGWPEKMKEVLRTPQHLKIFLRTIPEKALEVQIFQSYLAMLHVYWEQQLVAVNSECEDILLSIALKMSEREDVWLPLAQFDRQIVSKLVALGFLEVDPIKGRLGFQHQTVFEYARARAFIKSEASLCQHVLERQHGLFVRPLLWTLLPYLRESNNFVYRRELSSLWKENIRFHLRALLIEFLGLVEEPTSFEYSLLLGHIDNPEFEDCILFAIAKNERWFRKLHPQYLPQLMTKQKVSNALLRLLTSAVIYAQNDVLTLVKEYWLSNPEEDNRTFAILRSIESWNETAVEIAEIVISRTEIAPFWVCALVLNAQSKHPQLAMRLIKCFLERELTKGRLQIKRDKESESSNLTEEEQLLHSVKLSWKHPFKNTLDSQEWESIFDLALTHPRLFVDQLAPLIVDAVGEIAFKENTLLVQYRHDCLNSRIQYFENDKEFSSNDYSLIEALKISMAELAAADSNYFLELVSSLKDSNLLFVHSMLAPGLIKIACLKPMYVLDYLLEDNRRLFIGHTGDELVQTKALITAIAPHLESQDLKKLENRIRTLETYRKDVSNDNQRLGQTALNRLKLLTAIPKALLSKECRIELEKAERDGLLTPRESSSIRIKTSTTVSNNRKDCFNESTDGVDEISDDDDFYDEDGWIKEPIKERPVRGSSITYANLEKLAFENPQKLVETVLELNSPVSAKTAGEAIEALAISDLSDNEFFGVIEKFDSLGFKCSNFRSSVTRALRVKLQSNVSLTENILTLLERYLDPILLENKHRDKSRPRVTRSGDKLISSVLWGHDVDPVPSYESFSVLEVLAIALLQQKNQKSERWLTVLEHHLSRNDSVSTWRSLAVTYLKYIGLCDQTKAEIFLNSLFAKYPELLEDYHGSRLLAQTMNWTSEAFLINQLTLIRNSKIETTLQSFGELLCMQHLWYPERTWARTEIDNLVEGETSDEIILRGIAFSASNLWQIEAYHSRATHIITELLRRSSPEIVLAVATYISNGQSYSVDQDTESVLNRLSNMNDFLSSNSLFNVLESLVELTEWKPNFVYSFCMKVITSIGAKVGDIGSNECLLSGPLIDIAIRLQRLSDIHRSQGMDIFENLLKYRTHEAIGLIDTSDGRPKSQPMVRMPRRTKSRRR